MFVVIWWPCRSCASCRDQSGKKGGCYPCPQRPFEHLHQTEKVSALDFAIDLAHDPHIVVISFAS